MDVLLGLARRVDRFSDRLGQAVAWLSLVMVLLGAFNALARKASQFVGVNLSSNAFLEGQWYLFSLLFLLGAAWTLREDRHVRVDVLYGRLPPRARTWIDLVGTLLFLLPFCVFALWVSLPTVRSSIAVLEVSPDPGGLPRWPIKVVLLVAFALLFLQGLSQAVKCVGRLTGRLPLEEPGVREGGLA